MASTSSLCRLEALSLSLSSLHASTSSSDLRSVMPLRHVSRYSTVVRNTATEGSQTQTASPTPAAASKKSSVTIEYQRQKAKELVQYFEERKVEEQIRKDRIFGWTRKNEIGNGRWVMFGIAVGLLTEYATGSNFIDQLKIIVSNLGILDLE